MIKQYPKNKEDLFLSIKTLFNEYDNNLINDQTLINYILFYNKNFPNTLVKGFPKILGVDDEFNDGFRATQNCENKLGKNRARRIEQILNHHIQSELI